MKNLNSKQNKLDEEALKQQELLYTQVGVCADMYSLIILIVLLSLLSVAGLSAAAVGAQVESPGGRERRSLS